MNILLIGGTGTISSAITRQLAESGHELWLLNRGNRKAEVPAGVKTSVFSVTARTSTSTSVLPLPTINRLPVTSSQKERHWPTPIGSIRVTRLPVKSYCCENIERRAFL